MSMQKFEILTRAQAGQEGAYTDNALGHIRYNFRKTYLNAGSMLPAASHLRNSV